MGPKSNRPEHDTSGLFGTHVFRVGQDEFAYDLGRQQIVALEPELADLLTARTAGTPAALAALAQGRAEDGLFLFHQPNLVPRRASPLQADRNLQHLILTVTEACNLRCAYCLHGAGLTWVRGHGERHMPVATALAAVQYFLDRCELARPPTVSFYGGEPLLQRKLITEVVEAVRRHPRGTDAVIVVDTNGVMLDEAVLQFAIAEKLHLQFSLDGPPAIHDRHRRDAAGRPTAARILANIGKLLDRAPDMAGRLSFVATLAPPVDLKTVASFFAAFPPFVDRGIENQPQITVNLANLNGQNWSPGQETAAGLPPVADQLQWARTAYLEAVVNGSRDRVSPVIRSLFEPDLIRFHHRSRAPLGETYSPGGNCRPGRRKLHVTIDGQLQPCERTGLVMSLGDVAAGIRPELVAELEVGFHDAVADRCGRCWALRLCGVCFAVQAECADSETGELPVPESVCRRVRAQKEQTLKMMTSILGLPPARRAWLDQTTIG